MEVFHFSSPIGILRVCGSEAGIESILYVNDPVEETVVPECLRDCVLQLEEYFKGVRTQFQLRLAPQGTNFQLEIWKLLGEIPYGETLSYLELSRRWGDTKAVRAVGHANGQNKLNIVIPCHRVIGSNQKLIGYGGGLWRKEWLLKHEASHLLPGLFMLNRHESE